MKPGLVSGCDVVWKPQHASQVDSTFQTPRCIHACCLVLVCEVAS